MLLPELLVLVVLLDKAAIVATSPKPNVVFILGDDIGYNDVGWHNPNMKTPYMDKLAREGVILESFYALPVCTPSRASLMTGYNACRLGLQRGVIGTLEPYGVPTKFDMLPKRLKQAGYQTHAIGKWHLGYCDEAYTPLKRGFDTFYGFYNGAESNYEHCNRDDIYFEGQNCSYYDFRDQSKEGRKFKGQFSAELYANRATEIIRRHDKRKPLFLYGAFSHTHFPLQSKDQYCKGCEANVNEPRKHFCCAMGALDSAVKNITMELKRKGIYDNTIIIFVSDNGGSIHFGGNNYPLRGNKGSLWEGGSRTPAFVHSRLLKKKGYVNHDLIHITDWYPTLTKLAGLKEDPDLDGYDQWETISENKPTLREQILYNMDNIQGTHYAAMRWKDWKIIVAAQAMQEPITVVTEAETNDLSFNTTFLTGYTTAKPPPLPSDVKVQLYNLKLDPYESNDLLKNGNESMKSLARQIQEFQLSYYWNVMKPAIKLDEDPAGNPEKNDNWYFWVGWCRRYYDVPPPKSFSDKFIMPVM